MQLRDGLLMVRIHTSALTQSLLIIGWLLAGGKLFSWDTVLWALFGIGFHATGFLHNNLADWKFDLRDEHKTTHPHVRGVISFEQSAHFAVVLSTLTIMFGVYLTHLKPLAIAFLFASVAAGWSYNLLSKRVIPAPIFIALCFGLLPAVSYFSTTDDYGIIWFILGATVMQVLFLGLEGYIKDFNQVEEKNIYKWLGCRIENGIFYSTGSAVFISMFTKVTLFIFGFEILIHLQAEIMLYILFVVLASIATITTLYLCVKKVWNHHKVVQMCAVTEIITLFALFPVIQPIVGWLAIVVLVGYSMGWFVLWNRIYWGRTITPNV